MNQPTEQDKALIVSRILNSPEFHDSKRYQELLQYLVNKSSSGESLKETEIAHDLFSKDSKFDPSADSLIRSYISNLRKKLEHYYLTTTDPFNFKLEIPKGQYLVKYIPVTIIEQKKNKNSYGRFIYPGIISFLVLIIIIMGFQIKNSGTNFNKPTKSSLIWQEFCKKENAPVLIVIGDYLFFTEKNKGVSRLFMRDSRINNLKDFNNFLAGQPQLKDKYELLNFTYLPLVTAFGLPDILNELNTLTRKPLIKLASTLTWEDLENNNVIFLGSLKALYKLDTLMTKTNIRYSFSPNKLRIINDKGEVITSFDFTYRSGTYQKDFSIIVKTTGAKNNTILFLTGFSELGMYESVRAAVNSNLWTRIKDFTKKEISDDLHYFEIISQTEGIEHTVFNSEIKHFKKLP